MWLLQVLLLSFTTPVEWLVLSQGTPPPPRFLSAFVHGSQLHIHFLPLGGETDD